jgi:hypothetical protein
LMQPVVGTCYPNVQDVQEPSYSTASTLAST